MNLWDRPFFQFLDFEVRIKKTALAGIVAESGLSVGTSFATRKLPPPPAEELAQAERVAQQFGEPPAYWYGRRLFEWLFDEDLRDALLKAKRLAGDPSAEHRLRTRLVIDPELNFLH